MHLDFAPVIELKVYCLTDNFKVARLFVFIGVGIVIVFILLSFCE